ncbi:MAG: arginine decarboxylase, pyruvoyl-dependent [Firmicutes bacterium]|nr:arginine decarboxylase, pyruvoyl-dependent [Bacillota bacterium]
MLSPVPGRFTLIAGAGEGPTPLNAFDSALLDAGIGNYNLVRVSSIVPPGASFVETPSKLAIPLGALVPTAYGSFTSDKPGTVIAAAIAVGLSNGLGIIMEHKGESSKNAIERAIEAMVEQAFVLRNADLRELKIRSVEHVVRDVGCVFAGAVLWY